MQFDLDDLDERGALDFADGDHSVELDALLSTARSAATVDELRLEASFLGAARSGHMDDATAAARTSGRLRRPSRRTAVRLAIVTATLLAGSSAAAATGTLPDAAQSAVSRAAAPLGIDLPDPYGSHADSDPAGTLPTDGSSAARLRVASRPGPQAPSARPVARVHSC